MSQSALGDALGLTFQQVRKYEKGTNRIGASRLQHMAQILKVPVAFFFDGGPDQRKTSVYPMPAEFVTKFLATSDGLALAKAFARLPTAKLRRSIVALVEQIADDQI
jgi:transcriptional regulator with XRE-family HTH domain